MNKVEAIILAGGRGTRLRSITGELPKPLAPIGGRPFLDLMLVRMRRFSRFRRVVLSVGYGADKIIERYKGKGIEEFGFDIEFAEEKDLLDTGGAVRFAMEFVEGEEFFVLNGDTFVDLDFGELWDFHKSHGGNWTVLVKEVEEGKRYGVVDFDSSGRVKGFVEKEEGCGRCFINAGVYIFSKCLFERVPIGSKVSLERDLLPSFIKEKGYVFPFSGLFFDIGTPESYLMASKIIGEFCDE